MKKVVFSLLISLSFSVLYAQEKNGQTPYMTKSLSAAAINNVEVKTSGGSISVTGVNPSEARVEVYIVGNNNSNNLTREEIQKRLDENYNLDITSSNNRLIAIAKPKNQNTDWKKGLSISFKVFTPSNIASSLQTSGGSISLKNLSGSQDFATSGGSLHVEQLSGKVRGRTSGGSIHVENSKDDINLATSGGSIHAANCNGNLHLATSGGSLHLSDLKGNIEANTSGGSIVGSNIAGELATNTSGGSIRLRDMMCSLETSTSGGNIDVSIKELGKWVRIHNSAGSVNIELPNKGIDLKLSGQKVTTAALANFNGRMEKDEIEGKLNGGGIPVTVRAGSGKVNLSMR